MKELNMLQPKKSRRKEKPVWWSVVPLSLTFAVESDLTYVWDGYKINYIFIIIDGYHKEFIGDCYGLRCRAAEAIQSLEGAVLSRFGSFKPVHDIQVTLCVNQENQYIARKSKERAIELGVKIEYCGINCPDDKPYIENFFSRYKCEEVYRNDYRYFSDALLG